MTAELPLANAGFSYSSDPNTGMHRTGADAQAIECGGVDVIEVATTGATVNGALEVTGPITSGGVAIIPVGLGPLPWSGTAAPAKWLLCRGQSLLRASYPDLWAFASSEIALGNTFFTNGDGSTTFTIKDMSGGTAFGSNNGTGRLTTANSGVDGDVLGSVGGSPDQTILQSNLPNVNFTTTGTVTVFTGGVAGLGVVSGSSASSAQGGGAVGLYPTAAYGNLTAAFSSGLAASGGSGTALKTQPRTVITNYIIYAGA